MTRIRDKVSETHDGINRLRSVRDQIDQWVKRAEGQSYAETVSAAGVNIKEKLSAVEAELIQTEYKGARDRENLFGSRP